MAPLAGTYQFESQDNYIEYLQSLGLGADEAKKAAGGDQIVIGPIASDKITVAFGDTKMTFNLNKDTEYLLREGFNRKVFVTINGDVLTIKTDLANDGTLVDTKVLTPTDSGLTLNASNNKGVKGERRYKRV